MTRLFTAFALALFLAAPAFAQSSPEASGDTVAASAPSISEEVLERHVGGYELKPGMTLLITRDGDRLFAHVPGQDVFEIAASSETEFSVLAFAAQITFNRAPDGSTESLTLNQDGRTFVADRVE